MTERSRPVFGHRDLGVRCRSMKKHQSIYYVTCQQKKKKYLEKRNTSPFSAGMLSMLYYNTRSPFSSKQQRAKLSVKRWDNLSSLSCASFHSSIEVMMRNYEVLPPTESETLSLEAKTLKRRSRTVLDKCDEKDTAGVKYVTVNSKHQSVVPALCHLSSKLSVVLINSYCLTWWRSG